MCEVRGIIYMLEGLLRPPRRRADPAAHGLILTLAGTVRTDRTWYSADGDELTLYLSRREAVLARRRLGRSCEATHVREYRTQVILEALEVTEDITAHRIAVISMLCRTADQIEANRLRQKGLL